MPAKFPPAYLAALAEGFLEVITEFILSSEIVETCAKEDASDREAGRIVQPSVLRDLMISRRHAAEDLQRRGEYLAACFHANGIDPFRVNQVLACTPKAVNVLKKIKIEVETVLRGIILELRTKEVLKKATTEAANGSNRELLEKMSAGDLARALDMTLNQVKSRLNRFKKNHRDCFEAIENPRKGEARILYRTKDVLPVLEK